MPCYTLTSPIYQYLYQWQTLITGVFALIAAGVAFGGAIRAANIQARASYKQMQENFDFSLRRDETIREDEINNISRAIRREIIALSEVIMGNLRVVGAIRSGKISVMRKNMHATMMKPEPTIYRGVANRIGMLPYPIVQFYMRLMEIESAIQIIVVGPEDENAPVPGQEAETLAKPMIIACRLAQAIIGHTVVQTVDEEEIARITLVHIDTALERAKESFP